jgi:sugar lactone lactonase YvrE
MAVVEYRAEVALEVKAKLGEGPVWDEREQELLFVDILGQRVHGFCPGGRAHRSFDVGRPVGAVVLREDGGLVLAAHDAFWFAESDGSQMVPLGEFRADGQRVRFNDGKVDPSGRFLAGTLQWQESNAMGSLYMLAADGSVVTLLEEVRGSNGLAWSPDGTVLYYIDSPSLTIDAFSVELGTGRLSARRVVARVEGGNPDGMAIDDEGLLWVAVWDGCRVDRINPADGRRVAVVRVPTRNVSSVAFGGPLRDELFVTTARAGLNNNALSAEPYAGDLFTVRLGVTGPTSYRFKTS